MKAYDLLAALSVISTTKDIPLILMSSKISFEVENTESTYKFTSKINKPFRKNQLLSTLSTIIKVKEDGFQKNDQAKTETSNQIPWINNKHNHLIAEAHVECSKMIRHLKLSQISLKPWIYMTSNQSYSSIRRRQRS